jgi:hypothetical protein
VLALLRLTPHFFTLPILLNSPVPLAGVWGREGAVNAGVTARRSSAEEVSMGDPAVRRMLCRGGSKVLGSASPSSDNEKLFLFKSEGPAERDAPRCDSLAFKLLPRKEASSNVP